MRVGYFYSTNRTTLRRQVHAAKRRFMDSVADEGPTEETAHIFLRAIRSTALRFFLRFWPFKDLSNRQANAVLAAGGVLQSALRDRAKCHSACFSERTAEGQERCERCWVAVDRAQERYQEALADSRRLFALPADRLTWKTDPPFATAHLTHGSLKHRKV